MVLYQTSDIVLSGRLGRVGH